MHRQTLLVGLFILLDFTLFAACGRADLYCTEPIYPAGQVRNGLPLSHAFTFVNRGNAPVEITEVRSTCGCLTPRLEKRSFRPGEQGTLLLEINTLTLAEGTQSWRTRLIYRAGSQISELEFVVVGDVVTEVLVQPTALTLPAGAPGVHEITVTDRRAQPLTVRATDGGDSFLKAVVGAARQVDGTSVQRIRLEVPANCPEGRHDLSLHLYTNDPIYREFKVPITVVQRPRRQVSATPGQVTFDSVSGEPIPARQVRLSAAGGAIEVDHITADDAALRCTWEKGPDALATVKIQVDPTRVRGDLNTTVRVYLLKPAVEVVVIPVLCVIR